ncbi:hypothetical protein [Carnobacterium alterfunditum]|uniref:hypothetical protein n=1 Tax=Carnobacterium alterfunditum TaxID=28230 RepID=UPI0009DF1C44|nr:hypothetical protein [Carnobacterium alterfunditum]
MSKKTIKELSEEIGVSKTAISKKVTETQKKKWFAKIGNQFVISEEGQKAIKSMFISVKKNQSQTNKQTNFQNNDNQVYDSHFYQEQLLAKDKQIDMLQNLLKEQQNLLDQQQRLTLQTNKQIEKLQLESSKKVEEDLSQTDQFVSNAATEKKTEPEPLQVKKGFFSRLFSKKE